MNITDALIYGGIFGGNAKANVVLRGADGATADIVNATVIEPYAFKNCDYLASIELPNVITVGAEAFNWCDLESVCLPNVVTVGDNAFLHNNLKFVDLPKATSVGANAFSINPLLDTVILRSPEFCNFNVTAVGGTKILTTQGEPVGEGFVYVPTALFEDYVADLTVQATLVTGNAAVAEYAVRAVIRKIEDYPEICG